MDPALFCSFFLRVHMRKTWCSSVRVYNKIWKLCSQVVFPFWKHLFLGFFRNSSLRTSIIIRFLFTIPLKRRLTLKKERTDFWIIGFHSVKFWCRMIAMWNQKRMFHVFQCECQKKSCKKCNLKKKYFSKSPPKWTQLFFALFFWGSASEKPDAIQ